MIMTAADLTNKRSKSSGLNF